LIEIVRHFGPKGLNGECCENLSMPEFLALDTISNTEHCPVQNIGQLLGFTKSGATRIVNRLEKKGLVQKIRSVEDGRVCCVVITPQGENVLASTDERYSKEIEHLLSRMSDKNAPRMKELLKDMARALRD
jgi:DNA-binding MarR family transcriptional regulator